MKNKKDFIKVKDIFHLKELIEADNHDFIIVLNGGLGSHKTISLTKTDKFSVLNRIDESKQTISEKGLFNEKITNIGKAIKLGAFLVDKR